MSPVTQRDVARRSQGVGGVMYYLLLYFRRPLGQGFITLHERTSWTDVTKKMTEKLNTFQTKKRRDGLQIML